MTEITVALAAAAVIAGAIAIILALRMGRSDGGAAQRAEGRLAGVEQTQSEIVGQLKSLGDTHAAAQASLEGR